MGRLWLARFLYGLRNKLLQPHIPLVKKIHLFPDISKTYSPEPHLHFGIAFIKSVVKRIMKVLLGYQ